MRLHDRYLFREFLSPLGYCLGGLMVLVVASDAFSRLGELQEHKLHGWEVVQFLALDAPAFLVQVLPFALLVAVLAALTQHAKHNEITALRAAGLSLWRLCVPYFTVGLAATALMFWLNEIVVPTCTVRANTLLHSHSAGGTGRPRKVIFYNAAAHRSWDIADYTPEPPTLGRVTVSWPPTNGYWLQVHGDTARYTNGEWVFRNVQQEWQAGTNTHLVKQVHLEELAFPELTETPRQIASEVKLQQMMSPGASRLPDIPLTELKDYLALHPDLAHGQDRRGQQLLTKYQGRLAAPFTCLVVVLMAIPFGAPSGRRNLFFGVAGSIFICFGYYVVQELSMALGLNGSLPGWVAAWLPNALFAALGCWLIMRVR